MSKLDLPDYELVNIIGTGMYGIVMEAYDRARDTRVAIKRTQTMGARLNREYEALSLLQECENIVKLKRVIYTENDEKKIIQNLVFEYLPKNLSQYMESYRTEKKYIPIEKIKNISKQILQGLDYCHKKNIMHRDVKPENILITREEKIKICDFGSAKILNNDNKNSTPYVVTRYFRAPELLLGKTDYDTKVDIFAAGCIIAQLFTLTPLFEGKGEGLQLFEYFNIMGIPDNNYFKKFKLPESFYTYVTGLNNLEIYSLNEVLNPQDVNFYDDNDILIACDLILKMLEWNYDKRLSAEQCLKHPFFNDNEVIDKDKEDEKK